MPSQLWWLYQGNNTDGMDTCHICPFVFFNECQSETKRRSIYIGTHAHTHMCTYTHTHTHTHACTHACTHTNPYIIYIIFYNFTFDSGGCTHSHTLDLVYNGLLCHEECSDKDVKDEVTQTKKSQHNKHCTLIIPSVQAPELSQSMTEAQALEVVTISQQHCTDPVVAKIFPLWINSLSW